jgi:hypothetical protein
MQVALCRKGKLRTHRLLALLPFGCEGQVNRILLAACLRGNLDAVSAVLPFSLLLHPNSPLAWGNRGLFSALFLKGGASTWGEKWKEYRLSPWAHQPEASRVVAARVLLGLTGAKAAPLHVLTEYEGLAALRRDVRWSGCLIRHPRGTMVLFRAQSLQG